jgi:low affinity Fe/Cu permease
VHKIFVKLANATARAAGSPWAFIACLVLVIAWAISGPLFHYSEDWQLVINTSTTIVTFLMVFLIQSSQNRDGAAIQTKLDELIRSSEAENEFMGIEKLTDQELIALHDKCAAAAEKTRQTLTAAAAERQRRERARGAT